MQIVFGYNVSSMLINRIWTSFSQIFYNHYKIKDISIAVGITIIILLNLTAFDRVLLLQLNIYIYSI